MKTALVVIYAVGVVVCVRRMHAALNTEKAYLCNQVNAFVPNEGDKREEKLWIYMSLKFSESLADHWQKETEPDNDCWNKLPGESTGGSSWYHSRVQEMHTLQLSAYNHKHCLGPSESDTKLDQAILLECIGGLEKLQQNIRIVASGLQEPGLHGVTVDKRLLDPFTDYLGLRVDELKTKLNTAARVMWNARKFAQSSKQLEYTGKMTEIVKLLGKRSTAGSTAKPEWLNHFRNVPPTACWEDFRNPEFSDTTCENALKWQVPVGFLALLDRKEAERKTAMKNGDEIVTRLRKFGTLFKEGIALLQSKKQAWNWEHEQAKTAFLGKVKRFPADSDTAEFWAGDKAILENLGSLVSALH